MKRQDAELSFAALGHPVRFEALLFISQAGLEGVSAGEVGRSLNLPLTTLSFHLGRLHGAHLVERRKQGSHVIYSANRPKLAQLSLFLQHWGQAGL